GIVFPITLSLIFFNQPAIAERDIVSSVTSNPPMPFIQMPSAGPYYHRIHQATSTNGLDWKVDLALLFDHASVPGAVYHNGTIYLYYVNAKDPHKEKLSVAISSDEGKSFNIYDVVIAGSNSPRPVDPSATIDKGKIRLTYLGNFQQGGTHKAHKIVTATSINGLHFTEDAVLYTGEKVTDPDLFKDAQGTWVLLLSEPNGLIKLISKTTTRKFTKDVGFFFPQGGVCSTHLINGNYLCYYAGHGICVAKYEDGKLTELASNLIQGLSGIIADPTVVSLKNGTYIMYFKNDPQPSMIKPRQTKQSTD
ncbi:MAG: hypothetical protein QME05_02875, partial [Candidatus Margulisbacteria bacterium]|nr:hypothetical protein [Candidatus Margulisiibacteriota bacterium]